MMTKERFLAIEKAIKEENKNEEMIASFIDRFSSSVSLVLNPTPTLDCLLDILVEDFGNEEAIMSYFFPVFDNFVNEFWDNDGNKVIVNNAEEFYDFLVKNVVV